MSAWSNKSESISGVSKAFVAALKEMTDVPKNKKADTGKFEYGYADLASTVAMARAVLGEHGLAIHQTAGSEGDEVIVWTTVLHESGEFLTAQPLRLPLGQTAQQTGSSLTYGRRYALMAFLGLATEDDDGANAGLRTKRSPNASRRSEALKNEIKGHSADSRTPEEHHIREIILALDPDKQKEVRAAFKEQFGCTLSDLPVGSHKDALGFVKFLCGKFD